MKKTITRLGLACLAVLGFGTASFAQINGESPVPADFVVNSPSGIAGIYPYTPQVNSGVGGSWGPTLTETVTGDLVWGYDSVGNDSLCCDPITDDLTGKMVLIRRGACNFSLKVHHAELAGAAGVIICNHYDNAADDANTMINMQAADTAFTVAIPAVFISRATSETILSRLDNGEAVSVSFRVRSFDLPVHAYAYSTPETQVRPLEDMGVRFINLLDQVLPEMSVTVDITDPSGNTTSISEVVTDVDSFTINDIVFSETYVPLEEGEYTAVFSNSENDETFERNFEVTDLTFGQDNNDITDWIAPSDANFVTGNFRYDFGNFYRSGTEEGVATHVSFMLANPDSLFTGDPEADVFNIRIYDADPDGNGTVPGDADTYDALNEGGTGAVIVGFADYVLTGNEAPYELINVELEEPITLDPDKIYLVMVQYDGLAAGIGKAPWYAFGGAEEVAGSLGEAVYSDRFYTGGWDGNWKGVIQLHMNGYLSSTTEPLDQSKISVSPNPASSLVNLNLELDNVASEVTVNLLDFTGKLIRTEQLENVQKGSFGFDVSKLSAGTYFLSVVTPEGQRSKLFQVVR